MPKVIKFNTSALSNTRGKGNMRIGANSHDYGTSYYSMIEPPDGGYTIYENKASGGPSIRVANNEAELINLTRESSGTTYASAAECLAWFATQTDKAIVSSNDVFPNIITDGLVLELDASNLPSYPTTGTTWYDLSGLGNNCTLINGPYFSNGYINRDAANDNLRIIGNRDSAYDLNGLEKQIHWDANWSIEVLMNINTMGHFKYLYGCYNGSPTTQRGAGIWISNNNGGYLVVSQHFNNSVTVGSLSQSDIANCQGKWILWTITSDDAYTYKFYMNGVLKGTSAYNWRDSANRVNLSSTNYYQFGGASTTGLVDSKISSGKVYNKVLSQAEVLQNYYQAPIVTDGLVFAVDAGNLVSYESGSTTTYSLTGSLSGSLTNGTGYDSGNGGRWVFDGVDDYINCGSTVGGGYIDITAEVWTYPTRDQNYYFARYGGGSGWIILSYVVGSNRVFGVHGRELGGGVYFANNTATSFPENNRWYHLCYTKQANNWRLYINGALEVNVNVGSGTVPFLAVGLDTLDLGGLTGDTYTQGNVANGRIYNRALTATEVAQNFNAQRSRFGI